MDDEHGMEVRLQAALADCRRLRDEVRALKELLAEHSIPFPKEMSGPQPLELRLPASSEIGASAAPEAKEAKITLFRSLFRGRENVYAERWRTKDGEWAYRPASERDWEA
jgi:hypothetical protein